MKYKFKAEITKNLPYEKRPEGYTRPVWRYSNNPIIKRNPQPGIARIFNSALVPYNGEFIGVFRVEDETSLPHLRLAHSKDGINFTVENERIHFVDEDGNPYDPYYAYDPRLVKIDDTYYIMWCGDFDGAAIGVASTKDFKKSPHPNLSGASSVPSPKFQYLSLSSCFFSFFLSFFLLYHLFEVIPLLQNIYHH